MGDFRRNVRLRLRMAASAGETIENVAHEMSACAARIGAIIELQFNDVELVAYPGGDPQLLIDGYKNMKSDDKVKIVFAVRPRPMTEGE